MLSTMGHPPEAIAGTMLMSFQSVGYNNPLIFSTVLSSQSLLQRLKIGSQETAMKWSYPTTLTLEQTWSYVPPKAMKEKSHVPIIDTKYNRKTISTNVPEFDEIHMA